MERFPRSYSYTAEYNTTSANNSAAAEGSKGRQRSRVTNGSALLPGVDGRSAWVRRCKDIIEAHLSDLGGEHNTSVAERSLVRRAAVITTELEMMEARFAVAGHADPGELVAHASSRDLNPSISQAEIDLALERDPVANRAEYLSEWRSDVEGFIPRTSSSSVSAITLSFRRNQIPITSASLTKRAVCPRATASRPSLLTWPATA
jgi:hypothetical protein